MARKIPNEFMEVADILQGWSRGASVFGYDEVLVWWHGLGIGIALRGDALRIERNVFIPGQVNNKEFLFDFDLQKTFGFDVSLEYRERWGGHPVGIKGGAGQTMPSEYAHYSEALDGVERVVQLYLEERGIEMDIHLTLMPHEGSPWEPAETPTPYYNARTGKVENTLFPEWMIGVDVRSKEDSSDVKVPGVDFCKIVPTLKSDPGGSFIVHDQSKNIDFMVTHAMDLFGYKYNLKRMASFIKHCNGLLFPSMAVSQLPAANIGVVFFVIDPMVVLQGMKPYRTQKGRWPVICYTTDSWTETTRELVGTVAAEAFGQLTGQWKPSVYGKPHFYVLGPMISTRMDEIGSRLVMDTKKMSSTIAKRAKVWHRDISGEDIVELQDALTQDRYPYLEAKANGIVSMDSLVACVAPSSLSKQTKALLKNIGFRGELILIPVSSYEAKALEDGAMYVTLFDYSWRVHDEVVGLAKSTGRIETLRF